MSKCRRNNNGNIYGIAFFGLLVLLSLAIGLPLHAQTSNPTLISTAELSTQAGITVNTRVYTVESNRAVLYANSNSVSSTGTPNPNNNDNGKVRARQHQTDKNYQFVFIKDTASDNVYLYNVGQKKFVKKSGSLVTGPSNVDAFYVYDSKSYSNNTNYPLTFAFVNNAKWGQRQGSSDLVVNINASVVVIDGYSSTDAGNQCAVTDVTDSADVDKFDPTEALLQLKYYEKETLEQAKLTTGKVYTLTTRSGATLYANGSTSVSLSATTDPSSVSDADKQFVFFADTTAGSGKVYLYSVGKKRFLNIGGQMKDGSEVTSNVAAPLYFYSTGIDSAFAMSLSDTWSGGQYNLNVSGTTVNINSGSGRSDANQFVAKEVTEPTTYDAAEALMRLRVKSSSRSRISFHDAGVKFNSQVYVFQSKRGGIQANSDGNALERIEDGSINAEDKNQQFAFVTLSDVDSTRVYLYNVGTKKFARYTGTNRSAMSLVASNSATPVYVFPTGSYDYNLAFSFNENSFGSNGINISDWKLVVINNGSLDDGNMWRIFQPTNKDTISASDLQLARAALNGWLTGQFHYTGIHGRALKHGMQDVAEVHYYYYVNTTRKEYNRNGDKAAIDLQLPLMRYLARDSNGDKINHANGTDQETKDNHESDGNNMEPIGYFRWYDYRTDGMPIDGRLQPWTDWNNNGNSARSNNILTEKFDASGKSLGYFGIGLNNDFKSRLGPCASNIGAYYAIPDSANSKEWRGDIIACDVSRYIDYNNSATADINTFTHEPTLSVRYVFHILPADLLADELRDSLLRSNKTVGDKGILVFGAKSDEATMNLRTDLQSYRQYYFHPLKPDSVDKKHVYYPIGQAAAHGFKEGDFDSTVVHANGVEWRVYNPGMDAYRVIGTSTSMYFNDIAIQISAKSDQSNRVYGLRGSGWKNLNSKDTISFDNEIHRGAVCYLVGYLTDGTNKCPFFNASLELTNNFPKSQTQITANNDASRTEAYFRANFGSPVATFSFDNENNEQTLTKPTGVSADDNLSAIPSLFAQRQYSFVYYKLADFTRLSKYASWIDAYEPFHGDYCLYKSYSGQDTVFYDRTFEKSGGTQYGYFMFTDASDESRQLGYQDFQGQLCSGSQIILSAWVANTSSGISSSQPELRFTLYGVDKDAEGNDVDVTQLGSICSGNFANNVNDNTTTYTNSSNGQKYQGFITGTWYQVYGVLTLPAETNVSRFRNFRIGIDNFCNSTSGADYAIDDINVYQSNSKLTVTQKPALCENKSSNDIELKVKANFSVIRDLANADSDSITVYYRFCMPNDRPATGPNLYGAGQNNYGTVKIPIAVPADSTGFELDENGILQAVLVNGKFALNSDSTYYASLALHDPEEANSWGRQSDICTFYSPNFNFVKQSIVISGSQSATSTQLRAACGAPSVNGYEAINLSVVAPDQVSGGTTILNGITFDFFLGTRTQMNNTRHGTSDLLQALRHYRDHYPTGTNGAGEVAEADPATGKSAYTADDKALIDSCRYDATANPNGRLYLADATSLSGFPIPVGRQVIQAVPTLDTFTVTLNGKKYVYELCNDPSQLVVNVTRNGPGLVLGRGNVQYPNTQPYRVVRLGKPQIAAMGSNGTLRVPVARRTFGETGDNVPEEVLKFTNDITPEHPTYLYIAGTNDPTIDVASNVKIAELEKETLNTAVAGDTTLNIKNISANLLHEGYWYEIGFYFTRTDQASECPGNTYLVLKVVPEYLTWNPTADGRMNSNWNNDANWTRSTAGELYDAEYTDYRTPTYKFALYDADGNVAVKEMYNVNVDRTDTLVKSPQPAAYVPMYFSKVTIQPLTAQPYPMLGYILYSSVNGIAQSMTNGKNHEPTDDIEYDFEASPIDASNFYCAAFEGNVCDQILFKTGAQLRDQQFLKYNRAWTELTLPVNVWGTFTTPMKQTFAGDMYLPKTNAVQATPEFRDIKFDDVDAVDSIGRPWVDGVSKGTKYGLFGKAGDKLYHRLRMPTYQKLWGRGGKEYTEAGNYYNTHDDPSAMLIYPSGDSGDMPSGDAAFRDSIMNYDLHSAWSHSFNSVTGSADDGTSVGYYRAGDGVAGKIGDDYATDTAWVRRHLNYNMNGMWMAVANMRLPKSDTEFTYYGADGRGNAAASTFKQTVDRTDNYRLAIPYDFTSGSLGADTIKASRLRMDINSSGNLSEEDALYYVLIGNPYTSTISAQSFFNANHDALAPVTRNGSEVYRYWVLEGSMLNEYDASSASSIIDPGRSFFVKLKRLPGTDSLVFTTQMQVDPMMHVSAASRLAAVTPAKRYALTEKTDIENVIEHGEDTHVYVWSPYAGVLAVSGEKIRRVEIFNVSGQLVDSSAMTGSEKQFSVGAGIYIVRATLEDGTTEAKKAAVK